MQTMAVHNIGNILRAELAESLTPAPDVLAGAVPVAAVLMVTPVALTVFSAGTLDEAVVKALLTMVFMSAPVFALIFVATEVFDAEAGTVMV